MAPRLFALDSIGAVKPRSQVGLVDDVGSQIRLPVVHDCLLGGGFGAWSFVGRGAAAGSSGHKSERPRCTRRVAARVLA